MQMKKSGGGSVRTVSHGCGVVGQAVPDRRPSETVTQRAHVLEGAQALRMILDGDVEHGVNGFNATTDDRILHVPYTKASDAACAILLCRQGGILRVKLAAMDDLTAALVYAITLPRNELEN
jgi:hypothetical protein